MHSYTFESLHNYAHVCLHKCNTDMSYICISYLGKSMDVQLWVCLNYLSTKENEHM